MTEPWHLSRVSLRPDARIDAIASVLLPSDDAARISAGHKLVWSLFAGDRDKTRDFLWHEEERGRFLVFSPAPPDQASPIFEVETLPFENWPQPGDRLAFFLRANPTVSKAQTGLKRNGKRKSGKPVDVIMDALFPVPGRNETRAPLCKGEGRANLRDDLLGWLPDTHSVDPRRPIHAWLAAQGKMAGFDVVDMRVVSYGSVRMPREGKGPRDALVFGQADLTGELVVTDAGAFAAKLKSGFGRAKAFGCGLMLLRRATDAT